MQKRNTYFYLFLFLFSFSAGLFFLFRNNPDVPGISLIAGFFTPLREQTVRLVSGSGATTALEEENARLSKALRDQKKEEADLKALRDQFQTQSIRTSSLLPANIVGFTGVVPGVTKLPITLVLDKGTEDGVRAGQIVVYKDNVIGKVKRAAKTMALVDLVYSEGMTVNARTLQTNALGLITGQGQGVMQLSGVVLSEKLVENDQVLTKGDKEIDGSGYPPDLVIGKIVSVDKRASNLFQSAQVEGLIDVSKLTMVFIMTE